jgi:hypothetical protein
MSRRLVAGACGLAAVAGLALAAPAAADHAVEVQVLLAGDRIVTVTTADPSTAVADVQLDLVGDEALVGIDYRPADGILYGIGQGSATAGLYSIVDGTATRLATLNVAGTPLLLEGTSFGVDFNPAANALRIVSDAGQNLRVTPAGLGTGGMAATGATVVDTPLSGVAGALAAGAAYTNNDNSAATPTALFDVDAAGDQLLQQVNPNGGTLAVIGPLGLATTAAVGFDVRSELTEGVATSNVAYALLTQETGRSQVARLVTVDLATGAATELGALGQYRAPIGMAVALDG